MDIYLDLNEHFPMTLNLLLESLAPVYVSDHHDIVETLLLVFQTSECIDLTNQDLSLAKFVQKVLCDTDTPMKLKNELSLERILEKLNLTPTLSQKIVETFDEILAIDNVSNSPDYLELALSCWKPVDSYEIGDPCYLTSE